ncbi:MAG: hypothetical protein KI791_08675 [Cyclobacteriaceae bacterium]|nr:hypothetical protein [Cyclobacteriaceae bacterium SS2]
MRILNNLLLFSAIWCGCTGKMSDKSQSNSNNIDMDVPIIKSNEILDSINFDKLSITDTIINDEFSIAPLDFNTQTRYALNLDSIIESTYSVNEREQTSDFDKNWKYTIIEARSNRSLLVFIRSNNGIIHFDRGVVFTSAINISNNIRIGITKNTFLDKIGAKSNTYGDVIMVSDEDLIYDHVFYFEKDTLRGMKFEHRLNY